MKLTPVLLNLIILKVRRENFSVTLNVAYMLALKSSQKHHSSSFLHKPESPPTKTTLSLVPSACCFSFLKQYCSKKFGAKVFKLVSLFQHYLCNLEQEEIETVGLRVFV
jgi:hypothetical protein